MKLLEQKSLKMELQLKRYKALNVAGARMQIYRH
jgi:hypothetical protein